MKFLVSAYTDHQHRKTQLLLCCKSLTLNHAVHVKLGLQKYDLIVDYQPGVKMYVSDRLSRATASLEEIKAEEVQDVSDCLVLQNGYRTGFTGANRTYY